MKNFYLLILVCFILSGLRAKAQYIGAEVVAIESTMNNYSERVMHHNAFLDFKVDFGTINLAEISAFYFDIKFSHKLAPGEIDFYIDGNEAIDLFQTCLGANIADIVLIDEDLFSRTYRISANYTSSIPYINYQICPLLATIMKNVLVSPIDNGTDDSIYDCGAGKISTTDINIEIVGGLIKTLPNTMFPINTYTNEDTFEIPSCGHPVIYDGEYTLHAEKGESQDGTFTLDIFMRNIGDQTLGVYNEYHGNIRMAFTDAIFDDPYIIPSLGFTNIDLNGSTNNILSINFRGKTFSNADNTYHIGTIGFEEVEFSSNPVFEDDVYCFNVDFNHGSNFPPTVIYNRKDILKGVDFRRVKKCQDINDGGIINYPVNAQSGKLAATPLYVSQIENQQIIRVTSKLLQFNNSENVELIIADINGRTLQTENLGQVENNLMLSKNIKVNNLETGIYVVSLVSKSNRTQTKLFFQSN